MERIVAYNATTQLWEVSDKDGSWLGEFESEECAREFAAAPALYEVCERALEIIDSNQKHIESEGLDSDIRDIRAALALAAPKEQP